MKHFYVLAFLGLFVACSKPATDSATNVDEAAAPRVDPIKVGVILSEVMLPHFMKHSRNSVTMLTQEINEQGGIRGRPVEIIIRDDRGSAADAIQVAEELLIRENIVALFSHTDSAMSLALSSFSKRHQLPFFTVWCTSNDCTWKDFHPYIFVLDQPPKVYGQMFAERALQSDATKWATVAFNIEYGHSIVKAVKQAMLEKNPNIEFVAEQWPNFGDIDNGAIIQSFKAAGAEGVINVLFGPELVSYVRESRKRDFFENIVYINGDIGYPEEHHLFGDEMPVDWITIGYPRAMLDTPRHNAFKAKYKNMFGEDIGKSGLDSYTMLKVLFESIDQARSLEPLDIVAAAETVVSMSPTGEVRIRAIDHRLDRGDWVGKTAYDGTKAYMTDFEQVDVNALMPSDAWILEQQGRTQ